MAVIINVNGSGHSVDAHGDTPLLWVLRDVLGMTGTKFGCGIAQCGACTVHIDGKAVRSCLLPIGAIGNRAVTTIEGVAATPTGAKVQKAWLDLEFRHRRCHGRQHLPLRHLCPHPRGDQARRR